MTRAGIGLFIVLLSARESLACSVPVFRFALEQWPPSRFELILFHKGPLSAADQDTFRRLQGEVGAANLVIRSADLSGRIDPDLKAVWEREGAGASLPRLVLRYPDSNPKVRSVESSPLADGRIRSMTDSAARREIFDRLTAGWAGVVVLLLSGDAQADDAARAMLARELPRIAGKIELPARTDEGPQVQSLLPLRVGFPVVEVSRGSNEQSFVRMLVGCEDGLENVRGPIVFPVFGRGRALCAIHGKDLESPSELARSLEYLCRACSCQVKELNPGVDLLMTGNWELIFNAEAGPSPREVAMPASPPAAEPRPSSAGPARTEPRSAPPAGYDPVEVQGAASQSARVPWFRYAAIAAALVLVCTAGRAWRGRRAPTQESP
jgi:hypothetical protein